MAVNCPKQTPWMKMRQKFDAKSLSKLTYLFNTAYYVATEHLAFSKFQDLCFLQRLNDVQLGNNYINDHGCKGFTEAIANTSRDKSHSRILNANFISVMADGSTDSSVVEQEAVYARYVHEGVAKTELIEHVSVEHSTSAGVLAGIYKALDNAGINNSVRSSKLTGLNVDGASVNMGVKSGVQKLMKDVLPHIMVVHCINHNLELAILDVKKTEEQLQRFESTMKSIFSFYHWSPKKRRELNTIAVTMDQQLARFGGIKQIRWLASQKRALEQLVKNLKITITHLEYVAASSNKDGAAKAKGILKSVKTVSFVKLLHFMLDFSDIVSEVSLLFQRDNLMLIEVSPALEVVLMRLQNMKYYPGEHLLHLVDALKTEDSDLNDLQLTGAIGQEVMEPLYIRMIDGAIEFVNRRFSFLQDGPFVWFEIFNFTSWPYKMEDLAPYGNTEVQKLVEYFGNLLDSSVKGPQILQEWGYLKTRVVKVRNESFHDVYHDLLCYPPSNMTNILLLLELMMSLSLSTAAVERGFSCMNLQKNTLRSNMQQDTLNDLMAINVNGPPLAEFDAQEAIDKWLYSGPGTRHIDGHKPAGSED